MQTIAKHIVASLASRETGNYYCCCCAGVEYSSRNVLTDPDLREGVKSFSEWPTIPQVYIDGEFVGGSDILMGMHESGDLKKMFLKEQA